ncbi:MAG: hypothetical protein WC527_07740 [Candidatus Margulisiibacteriota bacterium]
MNRTAYSLISVFLAVSFALLCAVSVSRQSLQSIVLVRMKTQELKTFYLAESGLEHGKNLIVSNNSWFTENAPVTDSKNRLLTASSGEIYLFGQGGYKIIREKGKNCLYSIGFIGTDIIKSPAFSFQRIDFELPFKTVKWEEF